MNKTSGKYLPLTTILLAMNCSPSVQQAEVKTKPEVTVTAKQEYDCSNLDLTQKVGFFTSFTYRGERFCYHISSNDEHYYEGIADCDELGRPLPEHVVAVREFAGSKKGFMQLNMVLEVNGNTVNYLPFYREPSGEIRARFPESPVPHNLEQLFYLGGKKLDTVKNFPQVCKELLEYKTK